MSVTSFSVLRTLFLWLGALSSFSMRVFALCYFILFSRVWLFSLTGIFYPDGTLRSNGLVRKRLVGEEWHGRSGGRKNCGQNIA